MFKTTATGKNENYGKAGEVRYHSDYHAKCGVDHGWLKPEMEYLGNSVQNPTMLKESIEKAERRIRLEQLKIDEWKKLLKKSIKVKR